MKIEERLSQLEKQNRLFRSLFILMCLVVVALLSWGASHTDSSQYQLFQAKTKFINKEGFQSTDTELLRLDTVTGEVLMHQHVQFEIEGDAIQNSSWVPFIRCIGPGCERQRY